MNSPEIVIGIDGNRVTFASYDERLLRIERALATRGPSCTIGYANAHTIVSAHADPRFRRELGRLSVTYADGVGVHAAGMYLDAEAMSCQRRQNASDFNYRVLDYADAKQLRIFFVGGTESVTARLAARMAVDYPRAVVCGLSDGYGGAPSASLVDKIDAASVDILMVGMGQPVQERWIAACASCARVPVVIAVGGFLDFYTGETTRAPLLFRSMGMEWLFRLLQEPRRMWRRYMIGIPYFLYLVTTGKQR